jgi:hypothetical protein
VRRLCTVFAVPGFIDDQRALFVRSRRRIREEKGQPLLGHRLDLPGGLGEEELQRLNGSGLGQGVRFGADHPRERLVAIAGQQQPLHILPKAAPLGHVAEERIKEGRVILQGPRGGRSGYTFGHGNTSTPFYPYSFRVQQSNVSIACGDPSDSSGIVAGVRLAERTFDGC